jgi:hypothetical protein
MTYACQPDSITVYGVSTNTTLEAQTREGHVELEMIGMFNGEKIWMDITCEDWRVLREKIDCLLQACTCMSSKSIVKKPD